jgi:ribulose-phosphate 3-epimerase
MIEIIPAILTDSPTKFKDLVLRLEPYARRIHIDIADGIFVPNKTINGYDDLKTIESASKFDVHLMVTKPQDHSKEWFYTHAERFIIHAESEGVEGAIHSVREHKRKIGLALNPETPAENIENYLDKIDFVQFMTVHPGFQGGSFVSEVVDKISAFRARYPDILIMCDGGITPETAPQLIRAGANSVVSGSYVIKSENFEEAINKLKTSCSI